MRRDKFERNGTQWLWALKINGNHTLACPSTTQISHSNSVKSICFGANRAHRTSHAWRLLLHKKKIHCFFFTKHILKRAWFTRFFLRFFQAKDGQLVYRSDRVSYRCCKIQINFSEHFQRLVKRRLSLYQLKS